MDFLKGLNEQIWTNEQIKRLNEQDEKGQIKSVVQQDFEKAGIEYSDMYVREINEVRTKVEKSRTGPSKRREVQTGKVHYRVEVYTEDADDYEEAILYLKKQADYAYDVRVNADKGLISFKYVGSVNESNSSQSTDKDIKTGDIVKTDGKVAKVTNIDYDDKYDAYVADIKMEGSGNKKKVAVKDLEMHVPQRHKNAGVQEAKQWWSDPDKGKINRVKSYISNQWDEIKNNEKAMNILKKMGLYEEGDEKRDVISKFGTDSIKNQEKVYNQLKSAGVITESTNKSTAKGKNTVNEVAKVSRGVKKDIVNRIKDIMVNKLDTDISGFKVDQFYQDEESGRYYISFRFKSKGEVRENTFELIAKHLYKSEDIGRVVNVGPESATRKEGNWHLGTIVIQFGEKHPNYDPEYDRPK